MFSSYLPVCRLVSHALSPCIWLFFSRVCCPFKTWMSLFDFPYFTFSSSVLTKIPCGRAIVSVRAPWQHRQCSANCTASIFWHNGFLKMNAGERTSARGKARVQLLSLIKINHPYVHLCVCPPFHPSCIPFSVLQPFVYSILPSFHLPNIASLSLHPYLSLPLVYSVVQVPHFSIPSSLYLAMFFFMYTHLFFHAAIQQAIWKQVVSPLSLMRTDTSISGNNCLKTHLLHYFGHNMLCLCITNQC